MKLLHEYAALDLGTYSAKLLALQSADGYTYEISDLHESVLPTGMISGGFTNSMISDQDKFEITLSQLLGKLSRRKAGLIVGLPDRWVKLHLVALQVRAEELESRDYLNWRLQKAIGSADKSAELMTDCQVLSTREEGNLLAVKCLVGQVRKEPVEALSQILMRLKIPVVAFDTSTLGVFNLLEETHPDLTIDRDLIMCHIGHETTVVKAFEQGILRYERVIEVGGEAFTSLLAEAENLSLELAGAEKLKRAFFPMTREEMVRQIAQRHLFEKVFGNWLRELTVTFRFYQDKFKVLKIPHLYLSGGSSLFEGLPEFLSEFFETTCRRFNPLKELSSSPQPGVDFRTQGPVFAPALGLLVTEGSV
ncbi:MAG TPA: pilus assembly protein PilM [Candidatus Ozemobacteraceae bacterium]|nr:pilus assembly protein PilM [Candidatus Ozemobacteraceae bacterium]